MVNFSFSKNLDMAGMILSGMCAVHCAILPFILMAGMGSGFHWMFSHEFEMTVFIICLILASLSLIYGYFRFHRRAIVIIAAFLGFTFFGIGHEFMPFALKILLTSLGGLCILYAHYLNLKFQSCSYTLAAKNE